mmetsp:Transcript_6090/g.7330  ORF Transcript_6090/g.7330 Transcript_6090/m.7330 type:complete len:507 (-) Transcript_6090:707-2227(-)
MHLHTSKGPTPRRPSRTKTGAASIATTEATINNMKRKPKRENRTELQLSQKRKQEQAGRGRGPERPPRLVANASSDTKTPKEKKRKRNNATTGNKSQNFTGKKNTFMTPDPALPEKIYARFQTGKLDRTKMMQKCVEIICQSLGLQKPVKDGPPLRFDIARLDEATLRRLRSVLRLFRFEKGGSLFSPDKLKCIQPQSSKSNVGEKETEIRVRQAPPTDALMLVTKSNKVNQNLMVQTSNKYTTEQKKLRNPILKKSPKITKANQPQTRYCICQTAASEAMMIECSSALKKPRCNGWVHLACVGLDKVSEAELEKLTKFVCPMCKYEMQGKELDLLVSQEVKKICGLCHSTKSKAVGMGPFIGPFLNRDTKVGCWAHDFCAIGSSDAGLTEEGSWYNVAKTIHKSWTRKCTAKNCLQSKLEGASLCCTKADCETVIHTACCREILNALKRIPKLKSSNAVVQKAANEALAERKEAVIVKRKQNWVCLGCKSKKSFREGKRKSTRLR